VAIFNENCDLLADSDNISNKCKNYFSELWNVHVVSDIRHRKIHTAELLLPETNTLEVEITTAQFLELLFKSGRNDSFMRWNISLNSIYK
jgi:hypothetical protein